LVADQLNNRWPLRPLNFGNKKAPEGAVV